MREAEWGRHCCGVQGAPGWVGRHLGCESLTPTLALSQGRLEAAASQSLGLTPAWGSCWKGQVQGSWLEEPQPHLSSCLLFRHGFALFLQRPVNFAS